MTLQQRSKSELNQLHAIFAELGFGEAPVITGKHDLDVICRDRKSEVRLTSPGTREVGACGKFGYRSENAASRTARARMNSGAGRLRVYQCPDCKDWHLTQSVGERRRSGGPLNRNTPRGGQAMSRLGSIMREKHPDTEGGGSE